MIDKETWKTGTDHDKMENIIKYHMHIQYHEERLFKRKKLSQVAVKQSIIFFY